MSDIVHKCSMLIRKILVDMSDVVKTFSEDYLNCTQKVKN